MKLRNRHDISFIEDLDNIENSDNKKTLIEIYKSKDIGFQRKKILLELLLDEWNDKSDFDCNCSDCISVILEHQSILFNEAFDVGYKIICPNCNNLCSLNYKHEPFLLRCTFCKISWQNYYFEKWEKS